MASSTVLADDTVNWYEDNNPPPGGFEQITHLFSADDVAITYQTNVAFQLIVDPNADTDFTNLLSAGKGSVGWAIGSEHPIAVSYGADDDTVLDTTYWQAGSLGGTNFGYLPDRSTILTNALGNRYYNAPFYIRWFNTPSEDTATEAGIIYNTNWVSNDESAMFPPAFDAYLGYDEPSNLGSIKTNGTNGWQSLPRAWLTSQGTPMRWFVDHGISLEPSNTWDDADDYDSDTNGILNRAEYIAGTDPTNPASMLKILAISMSPGASNAVAELTWLGALGGATDTVWQLDAATNGIAQTNWAPLTGGTNTITGTGTNTWTQPSPAASTPRFYRIQATTP